MPLTRSSRLRSSHMWYNAVKILNCSISLKPNVSVGNNEVNHTWRDVLHAFFVRAQSAKHFKIAVGQCTAESNLREDRVLWGRAIKLDNDIGQRARRRSKFGSLTGSSWAKLFVSCLSNRSSVDKNRTPSPLDMRVDMSEHPSFIHRWLVWRSQKSHERREEIRKTVW